QLWMSQKHNKRMRLDPCFLGTREPGRGAHADQTIIILHAKVAQKSYGNEKRFFCPPPCVYITGHGWRITQDHLKGKKQVLCSVTYTLSVSVSVSLQQMFACAKSLFISDQDKRKHFRLLLQLFLGNRQEVGSFQSRMIKVISKPSQKRQSMKNADLCISSCSRVALFNRLRSQTVSTRYLSVDRGAFIASARQWTAFTITMGRCRADQGDFVLNEGFICYGCVVQLVCTETGVALPPMVIRKVNKQHAILDVDEPVSQLHKCSFQFRDDPQAFLCLSNDTIIQHQVNGGGHVAMLEISGENFSPHLKVWFGNIEAETMFKSPKSLLCVVPDVSVFSDSWRSLRRVITVPLALVRVDGLIYRTSFSFTYSPELHPPQSVRGAAGGGKVDGGTDRGQEDDVLLETIHQEFTRANFHLFMQS
uniref:Recombination signal binding protein for immunoglobulin kappa J region-like n=1 Tax=Anabas testudineus TaxID=64144 RepID=A0AAQ6INP3_ANATE